MARHRRHHRRRRRFGAFVTMPGFSAVSDIKQALIGNAKIAVLGGAGAIGGTIGLSYLLNKFNIALPRYVKVAIPLLGGLAVFLGAKTLLKNSPLGKSLGGGALLAGAVVTVFEFARTQLATQPGMSDFVYVPSMAEYQGMLLDNPMLVNPGYSNYDGVIVDNVTQQQQLAALSASAMDFGNEDMMERLAA